ncbi:Thioesterase/thiol ester dehydrase-isomerase [Apiospora saccharicola]|uniref:Thioesterase/thiol ester dehydrase-isomerase n=1 Tax=Apiospora saccharicola TaxID=335842 RepID=A0ABR1UWW3_9PEZI
MSPKSGSAENGGSNSSRLSFQEYMQLVELPQPSQPYGNQNGVQQPKRYMSQRASWMPGIDLPSPMREQMAFKGAAYGGHVYSQSGLAASKAFAEIREKLDKQGKGKQYKGKVFGIHTIHGYFSEAGLIDRPFIYEVTPVSTANLAFANFSVTARQPQQPTSSPSGDHYPLSDAVKSPMGPICFTALVSFRPASSSQAVSQEDPPQHRFAHILDSRPPHKWDPAPLVDIDRVVAMLPPGKKRGAGTFPCVDMKKQEKKRKQEQERKKKGGKEEMEDPDAHILTHAFEADRNGLLMAGNHIGFGSSLARAATLSYSFVVHVSPEEAIMRSQPPKERQPQEDERYHHEHQVELQRQHEEKMRELHEHEKQRKSSSTSYPPTLSLPFSPSAGPSYSSHDHDPNRHSEQHGRTIIQHFKHEDDDEKEQEEDEEAGNKDEWWIQEATFPRVEANRCVVLSKIWSPRGKHVATEYQDGIIQSREGPDPRRAHRTSKL